MMKKLKDERLQCRCCGVRTWSKDYGAFMKDHDRPDGRVCQAAKKLTAA